MDIQARLLTKNHSSVVPSQVVYFDTETEEERHGELSIHRMKMAWTCKVEYDSKVKELWWEDEIQNENKDADKLRELINLIRDIVKSKDEYKELPEPKGGYM